MAAVALSLRATFIQIDEATARVEEAEVGRRPRPRAASLPPATKAAQEGADMFEEQVAYVAGLSSKLRSLWSTAPTPSGFDARSFFQQAITPTKSQDIDQQLPLTPAMLKKQDINQATSVLLLRAKMEEQFTAAADSSTRTPTSGVSTEGYASSQDSQEALNDGSWGHPEVCARPCLYFANGGCVHGLACSFCHLPHLRRPVHLDKKHREVLKMTPSKKLIALIAPMLKEKLLSFDSSKESSKAFDRFMITCGFDSIAASRARVARADRSLLVSFRSMSFRLLLITLLRTALKDNIGAQEEGSALLAQLIRSSAGAIPANVSGVGGEGLGGEGLVQ